MGGCGVARGLGGAGRPAGPIKKKATPMAGRGEGLPAGCGVPVGPLGPIKRKAAFVARWGAGFPAGRVMPESPLADFGRVRGEAGFVVSPRSRRRKGHGDAPCAPARQGWAGAAAASVKAMEMQVGRRPVYGGAPRIGR